MGVCFVECMDVMKPLHKADKARRCVSLGWATSEDFHYTIFPFGSDYAENVVRVGAWHGTERVVSLRGMVYVLSTLRSTFTPRDCIAMRRRLYYRGLLIRTS